MSKRNDCWMQDGYALVGSSFVVGTICGLQVACFLACFGNPSWAKLRPFQATAKQRKLRCEIQSIQIRLASRLFLSMRPLSGRHEAVPRLSTWLGDRRTSIFSVDAMATSGSSHHVLEFHYHAHRHRPVRRVGRILKPLEFRLGRSLSAFHPR